MPHPADVERVPAASTAGPASGGARAGRALRPLRLAVLGIVVVVVCTADPRPASAGRGLVVLVALAAYAAGAIGLVRLRGTPAERPVVIALGAAAVVLAAEQPHGAAAIAGGLPVFVAFSWLPPATARVVGGGVALGIAVAVLAHDVGEVAEAAADVLLLVLMAAVATLLRRSEAERDRIAELYAQLQETRDAQAVAAASAERARIAGELHDVLAHSLSGAAIQLQGTRRLLAQDAASQAAVTAVDRAAELVREGLVDARRAVGALRGDALPTVAELPGLVSRLEDLRADVAFTARGEAGPEPAPEAGLALYRAAQEALTNVVRHAPGARAVVDLESTPDEVVLTVTNRLAPTSTGGVASGVGGGHGLETMRERLAGVGGACTAGPVPSGWAVRAVVPR